MACCWTSVAAHIFTAASMNWSPISAAVWKTLALPIRSPLPALSAPRGLSHIMENRQVMLAAKNVRYSRHCHCPCCGFRRQQSQVLPVLAWSASAISSTCRAHRSLLALAPEVLRQLDRALGHEHEPLTPR